MTGDTERRQTPSERQHEALMQALSRTPRGPEYAGKLTLNAKGDVQIEWEAKGDNAVYVLDALKDGFDVLMQKYPRPEPTDADKAAKELGNAARIHAARAKKAEGGS